MSQANKTTTSRRTLLTRAVAVSALAGGAIANAVAITTGRPMIADPVLAAIREHREAQEELQAACDANDLDMDECPRKEAAQRRAVGAELPLFTTRPITLLGLAALLMYVTSGAHEICREEDGQTVIEFARGWQNETELLDAIARFPRHIDAAFDTITAGGAHA
jgi:hypothetical protein